jgi:hypothetical protein
VTGGVVIPPKNAFGERDTVNRNISTSQVVWNFRSALNVAALNCMGTDYSLLVDNYGAMLKRHSRALSAANRGVEQRFRDEYGARYVVPRESYMTKVYNYFAFPPTMPELCDVANRLSFGVTTVEPAQFETFAARGLAELDEVLISFYDEFEAWRVALAEWQETYGEPVSAPIMASSLVGESVIQTGKGIAPVDPDTAPSVPTPDAPTTVTGAPAGQPGTATLPDPDPVRPAATPASPPSDEPVYGPTPDGED